LTPPVRGALTEQKSAAAGWSPPFANHLIC
jgi:hypothetical protein